MAETLTGTGVVPGIAAGPAFLWCRTAPLEGGTTAGPPEAETSGLDGALQKTRRRLLEIVQDLTQRIGASEARIFKSHLALLEDPLLLDQVRARISLGMGAAEAVGQAVTLLAGKLEALNTPRLRDRAADLRDVGKRLVEEILGAVPADKLESAAGVLCANDLTPSEISSLDAQKVRGVALEEGTAVSHTVILARALGLPTVVGIKGLLARVNQGDLLVLDGGTGRVTVRAEEETAETCRSRSPARRQSGSRRASAPSPPAVTRDGYRVKISANIGSPAEIRFAIDGGGEGIGLFRTEFLFLNRGAPPSEEDQFAAYREALAAMSPGRVVIRTADLGGDKQAAFLMQRPESNPALGLRGIRLSLQREAFFRTQVRAMLRAGRFGDLAILLPMVTGISEVRHARRIIGELAREINTGGEMAAESFPLGVMIETPAAALMAEALAREADFFSLGTNDLTQYVLAVDRLNDQVSALYDPFHPAVLRLMHEAAQAAGRNGKPLSVCGELAGDPAAAAFFVGLGVAELSMSPDRFGPVREAIGRLRKSEAASAVREALAAEDGREAAERLRSCTEKGTTPDVRAHDADS